MLRLPRQYAQVRHNTAQGSTRSAQPSLREAQQSAARSTPHPCICVVWRSNYKVLLHSHLSKGPLGGECRARHHQHAMCARLLSPARSPPLSCIVGHLYHDRHIILDWLISHHRRKETAEETHPRTDRPTDTFFVLIPRLWPEPVTILGVLGAWGRARLRRNGQRIAEPQALYPADTTEVCPVVTNT